MENAQQRHENAHKIRFRPGVCVRVTHPTSDHSRYQNDIGNINDVREIDPFLLCQVFLKGAAQMVYFDWEEIDLEE